MKVDCSSLSWVAKWAAEDKCRLAKKHKGFEFPRFSPYVPLQTNMKNNWPMLLFGGRENVNDWSRCPTNSLRKWLNSIREWKHERVRNETVQPGVNETRVSPPPLIPDAAALRRDKWTLTSGQWVICQTNRFWLTHNQGSLIEPSACAAFLWLAEEKASNQCFPADRLSVASLWLLQQKASRNGESGCNELLNRLRLSHTGKMSKKRGERIVRGRLCVIHWAPLITLNTALHVSALEEAYRWWRRARAH